MGIAFKCTLWPCSAGEQWKQLPAFHEYSALHDHSAKATRHLPEAEQGSLNPQSTPAAAVAGAKRLICLSCFVEDHADNTFTSSEVRYSNIGMFKCSCSELDLSRPAILATEHCNRIRFWCLFFENGT